MSSSSEDEFSWMGAIDSTIPTSGDVDPDFVEDMTDKPISGAAAGGDGESSDDDGDDDAFGWMNVMDGTAIDHSEVDPDAIEDMTGKPLPGSTAAAAGGESSDDDEDDSFGWMNVMDGTAIDHSEVDPDAIEDMTGKPIPGSTAAAAAGGESSDDDEDDSFGWMNVMDGTAIDHSEVDPDAIEDMTGKPIPGSTAAAAAGGDGESSEDDEDDAFGWMNVMDGTAIDHSEVDPDAIEDMTGKPIPGSTAAAAAGGESSDDDDEDDGFGWMNVMDGTAIDHSEVDPDFVEDMTGKALPGGSPGKKAMEAVGSEGVPVGLDGEEVDCWFVGGTTRFVPSGTQAKLVHFSFEASEDVQTVDLVGDFTKEAWKEAVPMTEAGGSQFTAAIYLPPGKFMFKYVLDKSEWVTDANVSVERLSDGIENNVLVVADQECEDISAARDADLDDIRDGRYGGTIARSASERILWAHSIAMREVVFETLEPIDEHLAAVDDASSLDFEDEEIGAEVQGFLRQLYDEMERVHDSRETLRQEEMSRRMQAMLKTSHERQSFLEAQ